MNAVSCPHCGAANAAGTSFCESCGKAMPQASGGPRVIDEGELAGTSAGQSLQAEELRKKMRSATGALIAVAILMGIGILALPYLIESQAKSEMKRLGPGGSIPAPQIGQGNRWGHPGSTCS